jgi:hypothetical protein
VGEYVDILVCGTFSGSDMSGIIDELSIHCQRSDEYLTVGSLSPRALTV